MTKAQYAELKPYHIKMKRDLITLILGFYVRNYTFLTTHTGDKNNDDHKINSKHLNLVPSTYDKFAETNQSLIKWLDRMPLRDQLCPSHKKGNPEYVFDVTEDLGLSAEQAITMVHHSYSPSNMIKALKGFLEIKEVGGYDFGMYPKPKFGDYDKLTDYITYRDKIMSQSFGILTNPDDAEQMEKGLYDAFKYCKWLKRKYKSGSLVVSEIYVFDQLFKGNPDLLDVRITKYLGLNNVANGFKYYVDLQTAEDYQAKAK